MVSRIQLTGVSPLRIWAFLFGLALLAAAVRADGSEKGTSYRLAAAGNDYVVWAVISEWSAEADQWVNWLGYREKTKPRMVPAISIGPQIRQIDRLAVVGENLHVFFENGTHYQYAKSWGRREQHLPGRVVPLAIAGEATRERPMLWAVVKPETAKAVWSRWAKRVARRGTQPSATREVDVEEPVRTTVTTQVGAVASDVVHLVQYDGSTWRPGFAGPGGCEPNARVWLCVSVDAHHLLWQSEEDDSRIHYATYEEGRWRVKKPIQLAHAVHHSIAAVINRQVIFAGLVDDGEQSPLMRCDRWVWLPKNGENGVWDALSSLQADGDGQTIYLPTNAALSALGDQLMALRMGEEGDAEAASWRAVAEGPPAEPFQVIPVLGRGGERGEAAPQDLFAMMIVGAVMLLVLWVRREKISLPVALPAGYSIVGPGKRAVAALIDLLPAMIVAGMIWYEPLLPFSKELSAAFRSGDEETLRSLEAPASLLWAGVSFRLMYALYCLVLELLMGATPGKRLLGSMVLSESLERPNTVQIVIRNITKLIELEPALLIWPFMLVIFFTTNRQRIGDLLARTIVVERQPGLEQAEPKEPNPPGDE